VWLYGFGCAQHHAYLEVDGSSLLIEVTSKGGLANWSRCCWEFSLLIVVGRHVPYQVISSERKYCVSLVWCSSCRGRRIAMFLSGRRP
jgi:hypothetical protein